MSDRPTDIHDFLPEELGMRKTRRKSGTADARETPSALEMHERDIYVNHIAQLRRRNDLLQKRLDEAQAQIAKFMRRQMRPSNAAAPPTAPSSAERATA